jgi:hypothetical protein
MFFAFISLANGYSQDSHTLGNCRLTSERILIYSPFV